MVFYRDLLTNESRANDSESKQLSTLCLFLSLPLPILMARIGTMIRFEKARSIFQKKDSLISR